MAKVNDTAISHDAPVSRLSDSAKTFVYLRDLDFNADFARMREKAKETLQEADQADRAGLDRRRTCW